MTKRQKRAERQAEWNKAITEGRVIRFDSGRMFKAFATVEAADDALALALKDGLDANRVSAN